MDDLVRLSLRSFETQTSHSQAITGTPCEVPEPRTTTFPFTLRRYAYDFIEPKIQ